MIDPGSVVDRIDELRAEIAKGEQALGELDSRREQLVAGMMRLSGAVQALEELVATDARTETTTVLQ